MERSAGILLPITALPSPYGIGTLGKSARAVADFLHAAGQTCWQVLPLGPTGWGDSPYQSFSTFAGNPYLIDLDLLAKDGLLTQKEISSFDWGANPRFVDYDTIYRSRFALLRLAFARGWERDRAGAEEFTRRTPWLPDYALFMALKHHFGTKCWLDWPDEGIRLRKPESIAHYTELLAEEIHFHVYLQYLFARQWDNLRAYVNGLGIRIIGDLPIYVSLDSADVWAEPEFFQLDDTNHPTEVAGVPPDYFSEDGQFWGNPLYDYDKMRADGFGWWIRRVEGAGKLFDMIRIDHFRGLENYWAVPCTAATAREGRWCKGPGMDLVGVLTGWFPQLHFIAEDLGIITPEVARLLSDSGLPGMRVLQFAFDPDADSAYLPHNHVPNSICYTGTHDNDTLVGWLNSAPPAELAFARRYLGLNEEEELHWGILRGGMTSVANLFIAPIQDYLGLDSSARINTPGTAQGNWQWRLLPGELDRNLADRIAGLTRISGRLPKRS